MSIKKIIMVIIGVIMVGMLVVGCTITMKITGIKDKDVKLVDYANDLPISQQIPKQDLATLDDDQAAQLEQQTVQDDEDIVSETINHSEKNQIRQSADLMQNEDATKKTVNRNIYRTSPIRSNIFNMLVILDGSSMIASYNKDSGAVKLISINSSILLPIEGYGWERMSTAYQLGGAGCVINSLNDVLGMDMQGYVIASTSALWNAVDQLGGVSINISQGEADYLNQATGTTLVAGTVSMDSNLAKLYGKYSADGQGNTRFKKVASAVYNTSNNAGQLATLLNDGLSSMSTNISLNSLKTMGQTALKTQSVSRSGIPVKGSTTNKELDGKLAKDVDWESNKNYVHAYLY